MADERWSDAEQQYTEALAINPRSPDCLIARAAVRMNQAKWDEALEDLDRALEIRPDPTAYAYRAVVLRALGRDAEARADEARAEAMGKGGRGEGEW